MNLEIEYKVMVNKEDFNKLIKKVEGKEFIQTNYYFDSEDGLLKKNKMSLRIRNVFNKYIMTLKTSASEGKYEYEYEVLDNKINKVPLKIKELLKINNIDVSLLKEIATLTTIRKEFIKDNCLICLDHSMYYGKDDYEIECEATSINKAKEVLSNYLKENNVSFTESKQSKIARAVQNKIQS